MYPTAVREPGGDGGICVLDQLEMFAHFLRQSVLPKIKGALGTSYIIAALFAAGFCGITWWGRIESARIDAMAVSTEARSAGRQLVDRSRQLFDRADQLTLLAERFPITALRAQDYLIDGPDNSAVILVDTRGRVLDSTLGSTADGIIAQPYLARADLHILPPMNLGASKEPFIPLVRSLHNAKGERTGSIILAIRSAYFTETQGLPRRKDTMFALVDATGQAVAATTDGKGYPLPLPRLAPDVWNQVQALGQTTGKNLPVLTSVFDPEERFTLLVDVGAHGVKALVAVPFVSAAANTKKLFVVIYLVVGFLSLSAIGVAGILHRQTRRLHLSVQVQEHAKEALRKEKEFFAITLGSIEDGVVTLDGAGCVTYCNQRAEMLTDWSAQKALGRRIAEVVRLVPGGEAELCTTALLTSDTRGAADLLSRIGESRPVEYSVTTLAQPHGATCAVLVLRDVSQAAQMANKLSHQASHDALTGLLNRTAFDAKVDAALESALHEGQAHVLLFLDLDQFKVVNDSCGHAAGDELLKQVSFIFGQALRRGDTLARTGGDEFAVLMENCPADVAIALSDKLRSALASFRFSWQDKSFQVGVSIGAVEITATSGTRGELMRKADTACYLAKDGGRGRTHLYLDSDEAVVTRQGELNWASRLQQALANSEFELQGQRISAPGDASCGHYFEMLVRLREADGRLVPPMAFLPAAERYGLMPTLDRTVIKLALKMHSQTQSETTYPVKFAINLSGGSLSDPTLLPFIREALAEHQVPAHLICFEVTETVAIANLQIAVKLMTELKALGCTLSLDDFGSGMSSFSYLKQLPVDVVKIDGSFVRNMLDNPVDYAMVEAVNNIAHQMGLQTLAEYVESPDLVESLLELGVDMLQGYGIAKPQSLPEMLKGIRDLETSGYADACSAVLVPAPK